jgi:hypothetical protein
MLCNIWIAELETADTQYSSHIGTDIPDIFVVEFTYKIILYFVLEYN